MEKNNITIPKLILAVEPSADVQIRDFFASDGNKFYELLKDPPYLRYTGWNLLTLDTPKIKKGEYWEVTNGNRKVIRLYKDGSLVSVAYANQDFLGWGQEEKDFIQSPRLNTLALIEYVTEFVCLYKCITEEIPRIKAVRFRVGINESQINKNKLLLPATRADNPFYGFISLGMGELEEDFMVDHLIELDENKEFEPNYVAFDLLALIFIHFGISSDKIPYTVLDEKGKRSVNVEEIRSVR